MVANKAQVELENYHKQLQGIQAFGNDEPYKWDPMLWWDVYKCYIALSIWTLLNSYFLLSKKPYFSKEFPYPCSYTQFRSRRQNAQEKFLHPISFQMIDF